ncbi:actin nucleation-promoting factor WASL-like [Frankliniella occidentalis]|uniref:Actin nucleation-promoting factor WASL-like n=1 Tax=Frankliniella occidentalis TaxID=133901 RepID=A0A9C6WS51_FRAOC|nr:actin nucleation-promoting factor WASL-like [Frankliniella occidentalis]
MAMTSQWRPLSPPMRPSTPPKHFMSSPPPSASWACRELLDSPGVAYSPSTSSPLLLHAGLPAPHGPQQWGQDPGASSRYYRTSTSSSVQSQESSPPSASTAAPLSPSWHTAGHLWSPPHPPPVASPMRAFPQGVHHEGRDLPAFGERTAAAAVEEAMDMGALGTSTYPSPSAAGSEPTSATIDNLVALTQLLCLTDGPRSEPRLLPSNYNNNRNHFWGQRRPLKNQIAFCAFCKGNGELPSLYNDHRLHAKQPDGTMRVECPVLQRLKCEICGATGAYAHTRSHCPYNRQPSVAVLLKKTPRRCDGSLRSYRK